MPVNYLWRAEYVFFAKKARAESFRYEQYDEIAKAGWRVGINRGYTYAPGFPVESFQTTEFFDTRQAFQALAGDEIDLYPMDRTVGAAYVKGLGVSHSVVPLPKTLFTKPYLVPFIRRSDYPDLEMLMHAYYHELRTMRASGEYQEIQKRIFADLVESEP